MKNGLSLLGPYYINVLREENISGEHREWYEKIIIPKGHEIFKQILDDVMTKLK